MMRPPLILASSSPYRRAIVNKLNLKIQSVSPNIDETPLPSETPMDLAKRLSEQKARSVATHFPDALIIGSDQVAVQDNRIMGKPKDHEEAVNQLRRASGAIIVLYSGLSLFNAASGSMQSTVDSFEVEYRHLTDQQIENYLQLEKPYDCCGSLKAEGIGISLLRRLTGNDPNTLIGLPLIQLITLLKNEGIEPIPIDRVLSPIK